MSEPVELVFAEKLSPDDFVALVVGLGGEPHPDPWTDVRLSREDRHVWIHAHAEESEPLDPEDQQAYERELGTSVGYRVILDISKTPGSERVALEIIETAAERWHLVVDDLVDTISTPAQLRARADSTGSVF